MGLFLVVVALEVWPMLTFIRWRRARAAGQPIDRGSVALLDRLKHLELALVVIMVFVASAMARGLG